MKCNRGLAVYSLPRIRANLSLARNNERLGLVVRLGNIITYYINIYYAAAEPL